jgi:hypothetical protein
VYQLVKVAGIYFQVQQITFAVEELVGGETVYVEVSLDGILLQCREVVVSYVVTAYVVFLDDVLPRFLRTLVGQIEELDVIVFQPCIFFGRVGESFLAGSAPCAPDVEQDERCIAVIYTTVSVSFNSTFVTSRARLKNPSP